MLHRWQFACEVGRQHGDIETTGGHPPGDLGHVSLDPTQVGRVTRAHHGDAQPAHRTSRMVGAQCCGTSLQRLKLALKRRRPQFMTMRRGRRYGSDVSLALPGMVVLAVLKPAERTAWTESSSKLSRPPKG